MLCNLNYLLNFWKCKFTNKKEKGERGKFLEIRKYFRSVRKNLHLLFKMFYTKYMQLLHQGPKRLQTMPWRSFFSWNWSLSSSQRCRYPWEMVPGIKSWFCQLLFTPEPYLWYRNFEEGAERIPTLFDVKDQEPVVRNLFSHLITRKS